MPRKTEPNPEVVRVATAVRGALECVFPRQRDCRDTCACSAYAIATICRAQGIRVEVQGGLYHFTPPISKPEFGNPDHIRACRETRRPAAHAWVRHRRNFVDVTLTQFDPEAPKVAVLDAADPRYTGKRFTLPSIRWRLTAICGYDDQEIARVLAVACDLLKAMPRSTAAAA